MIFKLLRPAQSLIYRTLNQLADKDLVIFERIDQEKLPDNKNPQDTQPIFMTFQEAQEFLRVSHQTIYRLIEKQGLPSHKIGKKRVFLREELAKWIKDH